jgi:hypothetical protein
MDQSTAKVGKLYNRVESVEKIGGSSFRRAKG